MPKEDPIRSYKDLKVWQQARDLAIAIYRVTPYLPREERYGMARQMRDAALSVSSNIAEGNGRIHRGDYLHHLSYSGGSLKELESIVDIAHELGYLSDGQFEHLSDMMTSVSYLLVALRKSLER